MPQYLSFFLAGIFFSICFLINSFLPIIIVISILYLIFMIKYPEYTLFIGFLGALDFFSIMDDNFLRIPYLFRFKDILFILTFYPLLFGWLTGDKKVKVVMQNPITKCILILLALTFIQFFVTKFNFGSESIGSLFRIGRRYLYYLIFIPAIYILSDSLRFKRFLIIFIFSAVFFSFLYFIQFIVGTNNRIFLHAVIRIQQLQGYYVTRLYVSGTQWTTLIFCISFYIYMFTKNEKYKNLNLYLMIITAIQSLLTFGRAHIFGIITGTVFAFFCTKEKNKWRKSIIILIISVLSISMISVIYGIIFPEKEGLLQPIIKRVASTYNAIIHNEDTFGFRLKDSHGRIELIKQYPVFGVGFVHDESDLFLFARGFSKTIRTTDSGLLSLLIDFGIVGFIWLLYMSFIVYKQAMQHYTNSKSQINKAIIIGILSYYFGRLFSFITLADFVTYDGIVSIVLSLTFLELIKYNEEKNEFINNNCKL